MFLWPRVPIAYSIGFRALDRAHGLGRVHARSAEQGAPSWDGATDATLQQAYRPSPSGRRRSQPQTRIARVLARTSVRAAVAIATGAASAIRRNEGSDPTGSDPARYSRAPRIYRAFTRSLELLFELTGSVVELVTCAVFGIDPPAVPVIVVVSVNEALAPLARDGRPHVTTRIDAA